MRSSEISTGVNRVGPFQAQIGYTRKVHERSGLSC